MEIKINKMTFQGFYSFMTLEHLELLALDDIEFFQLLHCMYLLFGNTNVFDIRISKFLDNYLYNHN
jgi:hypothetical protein